MIPIQRWPLISWSNFIWFFTWLHVWATAFWSFDIVILFGTVFKEQVPLDHFYDIPIFCLQWAAWSGRVVVLVVGLWCPDFSASSELPDLGGEWGEEGGADRDWHRLDHHWEGGQHSGEFWLHPDWPNLIPDHRICPGRLQNLPYQGLLQSSQSRGFGQPGLESQCWFMEVCAICKSHSVSYSIEYMY